MGICALTLSYAAFGGFMFMAVENSIELATPVGDSGGDDLFFGSPMTENL